MTLTGKRPSPCHPHLDRGMRCCILPIGPTRQSPRSVERVLGSVDADKLTVFNGLKSVMMRVPTVRFVLAGVFRPLLRGGRVGKTLEKRPFGRAVPLLNKRTLVKLSRFRDSVNPFSRPTYDQSIRPMISPIQPQLWLTNFCVQADLILWNFVAYLWKGHPSCPLISMLPVPAEAGKNTKNAA